MTTRTPGSSRRKSTSAGSAKTRRTKARSRSGALASLRQAQAQLESIALFPQENPFPILRVGREGVLLYANPSAAPFLSEWNCKPGEPVPDRIREWVITALETRTRLEQETRSSERDFNFTIVPIVERDYVNLYGRDITERKQGVMALRESEERYRTLFDKAADAITVTDPSGAGRVLSVNPAACRLFGYDEAEFVKLDRAAILDTSDVNLESMMARREEQGHATAVLTCKRKDGTRFPGELTTTFFQDRGGHRRAIAIVRDITERRRAEDQVRHLNESLQNKVSELNTLLDILPVGVWTGNRDCSEIVGNPAAYRIMGLQPGINASVTAAEPEVPPLRIFVNGVEVAAEEAPMQQVARTGKPLNNFEHEIVFPDGTRKTVYASVAPLYDSNAQVRGVIGAYADFSERKRAEERISALNRDLAQRAAELETTNQDLESFSYSVSHDLRAPLASIENLLRVVLEDCEYQLGEDGTSYVRLAQQNALAMDRLIDALLSLSRSSRAPLNRETVDMRAVVDQVIDEFQPGCEGRRIDWTVENLPPTEADPVLIKQVWTNLISNALKYTRGREVARITVGSEQWSGDGPPRTEEGGSNAMPPVSPALVTVKRSFQSHGARVRPPSTVYFVGDNGAGFDMEHAGRLFGVFQRLHSEEDYEGTGVGLAIVQRIIRRHGGRVWAEAKVDKGATFYFTIGTRALPLRYDSETHLP